MTRIRLGGYDRSGGQSMCRQPGRPGRATARAPWEHRLPRCDMKTNENFMMQQARNSDAEPPTVLYVEDEPLNALLMQALFDHRPALKLLVVTSGQAALELAKSQQPVLLLLDLHLPDCHGGELLMKLRGIPGWQAIPAIAVTGDRDFNPQGTGFCEVWVKPFMLFHTLARIDHWLSVQATQPPAKRLNNLLPAA